MGAGASVKDMKADANEKENAKKSSKLESKHENGLASSSNDSVSERSRFGSKFKNSKFTIGDVVEVQLDSGHLAEGIIVERKNENYVKVDFGADLIIDVLIEKCSLIVYCQDFEEGDKVEIRVEGSSLFFVGIVNKIHHQNKKMDVQMESDDPDDIEYGVDFENARKIMSRRALIVSKWRRAFMVVAAANELSKIAFSTSSKKVSGKA